MGQSTKEFIEVWIEDNVQAEVYTDFGDAAEARVLAGQCRAAAKTRGISSRDVDTAIDHMIGGGDGLVAFLEDAIEVAAERDPPR